VTMISCAIEVHLLTCNIWVRLSVQNHQQIDVDLFRLFMCLKYAYTDLCVRWTCSMNKACDSLLS